MTDEQQKANRWLSRMDNHDGELKMLYTRREEILASMGGVAKYEEKSRGGADPNPTEAKNIEYTEINERIEKIEKKISRENARTIKVIYQVTNSKLRGMLVGRYINHFSWGKVGKMYYYAKSRTYEYRAACLDAVCPYIPDEVIPDENKFVSMKDWKSTD